MLAAAWVDVYVAGLSSSTPIFRQYPGAVGALNAGSSGARTYNPTQREWYKDVLAAGALPSTFTSEYQASRPMIIAEPYIDQFGRGYLLSVSGPVVDGTGTVLGVAGADIAIASLQEVPPRRKDGRWRTLCLLVWLPRLASCRRLVGVLAGGARADHGSDRGGEA